MPIPTFQFTSSYDRLSNVLINKVSISEAFNPTQIKTDSRPLLHQFDAIWDTGATNSVVSKKVINECNLKYSGMTTVQSFSGKTLANTYLVNIYLPNKVAFSEVRITEGEIGGIADVLIGMDIIIRGDFAVTNKDGKTIFSFRVPSIEHINFVEQAESQKSSAIKRMVPKVGRNDPCPCGSGKKFKKCCG